MLLSGELVANVALWVAAACTFATSETRKGVLSLCVVAWTLGLRHGLGAYRFLACTGAAWCAKSAADLARLLLSSSRCADMDHIVAIDNGEHLSNSETSLCSPGRSPTATRSLVAIGQTPVTVGLFFSLGHSTIVIAMTLAIIIATSAINKLPNVSSVGGLIGVSVSASFLFLLGESARCCCALLRRS